MAALAKLIFDQSYERALDEASERGCFGPAMIELDNGARYAVEFYDPVRLAQEINHLLSQGRCFAEAGVIVIPEVTRENMEASLEQLVKDGFFTKLAKLPASE